MNHILNTYFQAKDWELEQGRKYYVDTLCNILCESAGYRIHPQRFIRNLVGAFAALSPNNDELGNYRDLRSLLDIFRYFIDTGEHLIDSVHVSTYPLNKDKAWKILTSGKDPLEILGGNKVRSFYKNILDPTAPDIVTIDVHAYSCYKGRRIKSKSREMSLSDSVYMEAVEAYKRSSVLLAILPNQLQSTCWLVWKRLHNIRWDPQLKLWT